MSKVFALMFVLSITILIPQSYAQSEKAQQIIHSCKDLYGNAQDISLEFSYQIETPMTRAVERKGSLKNKKEKYIVKLENQDIYTDGSSLWMHDRGLNEIKIQEYDPNYTISLIQYLHLIFNKSATFDFKEEKEGIYKVKMIFDDETLSFSEAYVWVNKSTEFLEKIIFIGKSGRTTTFKFLATKLNQNLVDSLFYFEETLHPTARILDERN